MNKLWIRITVSFFIISIVGLCIMFFFVENVNRTTYESLSSQRLQEDSELISSLIENDTIDLNYKSIQPWIEGLKLSDSNRYTIISRTGQVIYDSEANSLHMDNHLDRPEVRSALKNESVSESFVRESDTENLNMMYIASPIQSDGEIIGFVRVSTALKTIEAVTNKIWVSLLVVFTLILIATLISAALLSYKITQPIQKINDVTKRLEEKDYSARINEPFPAELNTLSESINSLAGSLNEYVTEIVDQSKQLESILSNLITGVILINPEGKIVVANEAALNLTSLTRENVIDSDYRESLVPLNILRDIRHVYKYDKIINHDVYLYTPEETVLNFYAAPYYGQRWERRGVIVALHNISDIKRLENVRRDFVANVSHELKTPITSIKGFAETLIENDELPKEVEKEFLQIIFDESVRLNALIADILNLSKIEKQQIKLNETNFDLTELVYTTVRPMKRLFKDKQLNLTLPEKSEHILFADKERVGQILINLLSNAVNYTQDGDDVEVRIEETEEFMKLIVHDTGAGIPEESIDRLFERFYRVDTARSKKDGGTGLGLAIVKHLVELHGGTITVDSIEGEHTTFTVTFEK